MPPDTNACSPGGSPGMGLHRRESFSLLTHPLRTGYYLVYWTVYSAHRGAAWFLNHPVTLYLLLPLGVAYAGLRSLEGNEVLVHEIDAWGKFVIWWVGLGVLSSIGFGTGMHSGILFLFPFIIKVCLSAEACKGVDFDTRIDVWYNSEPFHCSQGNETGGGGYGFWSVLMKVLPVSMLWGAGTAMGEIPPYFMSWAAAQTGQGSEALDEIQEGLKSKNIIKRVFSLMLQQMLWVIKRFGCMGVFFMASWPNAAFDLCGIVCGYLRMPFWEFFGATLMGKAVVKVSLQSTLLVVLFQKQQRETMLDFLSTILPDQLPCCFQFETPLPVLIQEVVQNQIIEFESKVTDRAVAHRADQTWWWEDAAVRLQGSDVSVMDLKDLVIGLVPTSLAELWNVLVFVMVAAFGTSVVSNLAYIGYKESIKKKEA